MVVDSYVGQVVAVQEEADSLSKGECYSYKLIFLEMVAIPKENEDEQQKPPTDDRSQNLNELTKSFQEVVSL